MINYIYIFFIYSLCWIKLILNLRTVSTSNIMMRFLSWWQVWVRFPLMLKFWLRLGLDNLLGYCRRVVLLTDLFLSHPSTASASIFCCSRLQWHCPATRCPVLPTRKPLLIEIGHGSSTLSKDGCFGFLIPLWSGWLAAVAGGISK